MKKTKFEELRYRPLTQVGIEQVITNLSKEDLEECLELTGKEPKDLFTLPYPNAKEIIDPKGNTIAIIGFTGINGIACPWLLIRSNSGFSLKNFRAEAKEFLRKLLDGSYHTILALKLASHTKQIRLLKTLGFTQNPGVILNGVTKKEVHEYVIRRSA